MRPRPHLRGHTVLLVSTWRDDPQRVARQRPLQCPRLIPKRTHPDVMLFFWREDRFLVRCGRIEITHQCQIALRTGVRRDCSELLALARHRRSWRILPFKPPYAALTQILDEIGPKTDQARAAYVPD